MSTTTHLNLDGWRYWNLLIWHRTRSFKESDVLGPLMTAMESRHQVLEFSSYHVASYSSFCDIVILFSGTLLVSIYSVGISCRSSGIVTDCVQSPQYHTRSGNMTPLWCRANRSSEHKSILWHRRRSVKPTFGRAALRQQFFIQLVKYSKYDRIVEVKVIFFFFFYTVSMGIKLAIYERIYRCSPWEKIKSDSAEYHGFQAIWKQ